MRNVELRLNHDSVHIAYVTNRIRHSRSTPIFHKGVTNVLLLMVGIYLSAAAHAEEGTTTLSLGAVSGLPTSEVLVPVLLNPSPPGLKITEVRATIRFDHEVAAFLRGEKSFLLDSVNAQFHVVSQPDPVDSARSVVQLEVATAGTPRKALQEGLLMTLVFRIAENANSGTEMPLEFENVSAGDLSDPPKSIQPIEGQKGSILVIAPEEAPYVACFFFTH